VHQLDIKAIDF